jgi:hypothetical protein
VQRSWELTIRTPPGGIYVYLGSEKLRHNPHNHQFRTLSNPYLGTWWDYREDPPKDWDFVPINASGCLGFHWLLFMASSYQVWVPMYGIVVLFVCSFAARFSLLRWRRAPPGRCAICGYDMRATPDRCPECGSRPVRDAAGLDDFT